MQTIELASATVWVADEFYPNEATQGYYPKYIECAVEKFLARPLFRELAVPHACRNDLRGYAVLQAYAGAIGYSRRYYYYDNGEVRLVQDWIDEVDGQFAALLILVCGTKRGLIHSERSLVIHPTVRGVSLTRLIRSQARLRLYLPGTGYLGGNQYRLRKAVDGLKAP